MLSWDDAQQFMTDMAGGDTGNTAVRILNRGANVGYKKVLSGLGRDVTEVTQVSVARAPSNPLVKANRVYQSPPNYLFMKQITLTVGGQEYPLREEPSEVKWREYTQTLQQGRPERYFIRRRFGYSGATIEFDKIPPQAGSIDTNEYVFEMVYESTDKSLSVDRYATGTVSLTGGSSPSASIAGVGTTWTDKMIGRYFRCTDEGSDGMWYKVTNIDSPTLLQIENYWEGLTLPAVNYEICELFALPEDIDTLPCYWGLADYFAFKQSEKKELKYRALFERGMAQAKLTYGTKSRDNLVYSDQQSSGGFGSNYPDHFPQGGISS